MKKKGGEWFASFFVLAMRMRLERGHLCLPGIAASADVSLSCRILIVHAFGSPGVAGRDACAPVASPRRKLSTGMKGIKEIKKIPFIPFIPVNPAFSFI